MSELFAGRRLSSIAAAIRTEAKPKPQSILVYGESFTGKSQLVAEELTEHFTTVIWLDIENGLQTLLKLSDDKLSRIVYIRIPDTATNPVGIKTVGLLFSAKAPVPICYEHGAVNCVKPDCKREGGFFLWDTNKMGEDVCVVVDSLTQISDSAMAAVDSQANVFTAGVTKAGYDEYGGQGKLLQNLLSHMQHAPFHRVFIGHADIVTEETGATKIYPVCGTRAFSARIPRFFDHVVYAYRRDNKHMFTSSTTHQHNIMAGSRSDIDIKNGAATLVDLLLCRKPVPPVVDASAAKSATVAGGRLSGLKKPT